jgi:hypothetical protein
VTFGELTPLEAEGQVKEGRETFWFVSSAVHHFLHGLCSEASTVLFLATLNLLLDQPPLFTDGRREERLETDIRLLLFDDVASAPSHRVYQHAQFL